MNFLEKDFEDCIWDAIQNGQIEDLRASGLDLYKHNLRQVSLGNYGIADLISFSFYFDNNNELDAIRFKIIELKRNEINTETFLQALRYFKGFSFFLESIYHHCNIYGSISLIGSSVSKKKSFIYMPDFFENLEFLTYSLSLNKGLQFYDHRGYDLVNKGNYFELADVFSDISTDEHFDCFDQKQQSYHE